MVGAALGRARVAASVPMPVWVGASSAEAIDRQQEPDWVTTGAAACDDVLTGRRSSGWGRQPAAAGERTGAVGQNCCVTPLRRPPALARLRPVQPGPSIESRPTDAPVAQLDRALPSEGRGHTFESCRVRHSRAKVGTIARAGSSSSDTAFKSRSFGPQMRTRSLPMVTLLTNMCSQVRRKAGSASRSRRRIPEEKRCTMSGDSSVRAMLRWRRASSVDVPSRICSLARSTRVLKRESWSSAMPASMAS